jgi:hypothetical protein
MTWDFETKFLVTDEMLVIASAAKQSLFKQRLLRRFQLLAMTASPASNQESFVPYSLGRGALRPSPLRRPLCLTLKEGPCWERPLL